jgi:hypothetical protein
LTLDTLEKFQNYLVSNNIWVQYKLSDSDTTTEKVLLNSTKYDEVYDNAYDKGYEVGKVDGETVGYNTGFADGLNQDGYTFNLVSYLLDPVSAFMNTELFGSFTIANAFEIIFFVAIALIFIKMFAG